MNNIEKTYCNPIPLPDYPLGKSFFANQTKKSYRETADPTVIYHNGKWYMYPSCKMAYVSDDYITWKYVDIKPSDIGYAPTVVEHNGKFLLAATHCEDLYISDSPLGPFECIGKFKDINGEVVSLFDIMLFSDDDGSLYVYGGDAKMHRSIVGAQLDSENMLQMITPIKELVKFDPNNKWMCHGEWNQNKGSSYIEGPYMYKKNGVYYLTFCAPGTQYSSYCMFAYRSASPLEGFVPQKNNPFLAKRYGIVRGPGHGCIVEGPNDTIWAFYTCTLCYEHMFERRIGMDCVSINEDGELCVNNVTEIPQWQPGFKPNQHISNDAGLLPLTFRENTYASSCVYGREAIYATDDSMLTWWEPSKQDTNPTLTVDFSENAVYSISSMRVIWRDVGMDIGNNILPGAIQYIVEAYNEKQEWECVLDMSNNQCDMTIDYRKLKEINATKVRITVKGAPKGIIPGIISFCVFGKYQYTK